MVDAVSSVDLVLGRAVPCFADGPTGQGYDCVQGSLLTRGHLPQRHEPQPVGGRHEYLYAGVRIGPGAFFNLLHRIDHFDNANFMI